MLDVYAIGTLCGDCEEGYGVTFDLRSCRTNCGAGGIVLFVVICESVVEIIKTEGLNYLHVMRGL